MKAIAMPQQRTLTEPSTIFQSLSRHLPARSAAPSALGLLTSDAMRGSRAAIKCVDPLMPVGLNPILSGGRRCVLPSSSVTLPNKMAALVRA
jgi:hypothetical protein